MNSSELGARASGRRPLILWVRKFHLYLGVLFAPAILFFASTGMVQVLSLHQSSPGYNAPILLQRLGALHKDQVFGVPHKHDPNQPAKPRTSHDAKGADRGPAAAPAPPAPPPAPPPIGPVRWILKVFALGAGAGLIVSTLLGLYMAFQFNRRNRWVLGALFAAGIIIPAILVAALPS
jgi:hypothetical protein